MPHNYKRILQDEYNVSRETILQLEQYEALLEKWAAKFNLVGKSTLQEIWLRHFLDSVQLLPHLPAQQCNIADIGSGAGFPAIPLALNSDHEYSLIESNGKKVTFLEIVKAQLDLHNVRLFNERIENHKEKYQIVTSRALANLDDLLHYSKSLLHENGMCLFLKGRNYQKELTEAQKTWTINYEIFESITDKESVILKIDTLQLLK